MSDNLKIGLTIGAALGSGFLSTTKAATGSLIKIGDAVNATNSQMAAAKGLNKQQVELGKLGSQLDVARRKLSALAAEMGDSPTRKMQQDFQRAQKKVAGLAADHRKLKTAVSAARSELRGQGVDTRALGSEVDKLSSKLGTLERSQVSLQGRQMKLGRIKEERAQLRGQMLDAVALGASLAAPIRSAIEFESVMADVGKVVNFESPAALKTMSSDLLKLSTRIPMTASGLGEIMAAAGQAGIARHELMRFTEDAAKMGVAFDMSGAEAGSAMTGLRSIFGLNQDQVVSLGDSYNHLSNNMDATARDMLNIANRSGSTARLVGLTGQQVGALGATFLALKTPPEVAATGINAMLMKLSTADKQGKNFQAALGRMGYSAEELKQKMGRDAQGTLLEFFETLQRSNDVKGDLSDLFGSEYADDMAKLVGSLDTYRRSVALLTEQEKIRGSMDAEYQTRAKTSANSIVLLRSQMNRLGVTLGSVMLPVVNSSLGVLGGLVDMVVSVTEAFPGATSVVVGLVGGLVAAKVAAIGGAYALSFFKGSWQTGAMVLGWVKHLWLLAGGFSGIGAAAGKARARVGGFVGSMNKAGLLQRHLGKTGVVGAVAIGAMTLGSVAMAGDDMSAEEKASATGGALGGMGGSVAGAMAGAALGSVVPVIGTAIGGLIGSIVGGMAGTALGEKLGALLAGTGAKISAWAGNAKTGVLSAWGSVKSGIGAAWDAIGSRIGEGVALWLSLPGKLLGALVNLPQQMIQAGGNIVGGLMDGIKSKLGALRDTVSGIGGSIVGWFKDDQQIKSPSRVWAGMGGHLMGGLALGIDRRGGLALASLAAVTTALSQPVMAGEVLTSMTAPMRSDDLTLQRPMDRPAHAAAPQAATPTANRAATRVDVTQNITINITQQPGESADALAERIMAELERRQRMGYHDHWGRV